ncbi:MAG: helix-turn-helix domain-containing protein [Ruminococcaceae bacterium]|nr:helix-turn-helix domain-containing protein [Oscillospiraceae bacterium]
MISNTNKSLRLTKNELMQDDGVYLYTSVCTQSIGAERSFSKLYSHDVPEISIVTSGSGIHQILGQAIPCKEGDIYIINSDVPHGYFTSEGAEMTVRHLLFDANDWFENSISDPEDPRYCYGVFNDSTLTAYAMPTLKSQNLLIGLLDSIETEITDKPHEWHESVKSLLSLILITVGRYVNGAVKNMISTKPKEWGVVSSAIQIVLLNFEDSDLTLGSIADSLYISKSHLSRLFKTITGKSFSDYLRNTRIDHAATLLVETDLTIEEIVARCGLKDIPTFYHTFRDIKNMTPHKYRTKYSSLDVFEQDEDEVINILDEISENLQFGRLKKSCELIEKALGDGYSAEDILNLGLLAGMSVIGEKFKNSEIYVPEVLVAARVMNAGTQMLKPYLNPDAAHSIGRVCLGTVQGDLHDIGKNLVKIMMEGKGIEVFDLGTDVPPERFIEAAIEHKCRIICCSALLSTTMPVMADVVSKAIDAGIRDKVKIMIGGAPVSEDYCHKIGADFYTDTAEEAAEIAADHLKNK